MKLLGLIGGVSPESTVIYYRLLSQAARECVGPHHSAKVLLYALDFGVMMRLYEEQDWEAYAAEVVKAAKHLEAGGAEGLMICSNTTQLAAGAVSAVTNVPLIHLIDALSDKLKSAEVKQPLLLGTPFVMNGEYYLSDLAKRYDGKVQIPDERGQALVGRVIFDELVKGEVRDGSREELRAMIESHDCDGVILGCTELCMILSQEHFELPVFDTTAIHAAAASAFAFEEG